jgi:methylated-DNA-protein-cysteine methyltransferase-like protein
MRFLNWAKLALPRFFVLAVAGSRRRCGFLECVQVGWLARRARKTMSWSAVYRLVKQIPRGRVLTYGQLARTLKLRGGARTAGRAMAACPAGRGIPWHRVVGARGRLLIREPYASLQRRLLESEGTRLIAGRVDLARHRWSPRSAK